MSVEAAEDCTPAPLQTIKHWFLKCDEEGNNIASRMLDHRSYRMQGTDGGECNVRSYKARIFEMMNFECVVTMAENDHDMRGIYAGHLKCLPRVQDGVVLKVSGVPTRLLAGIKTLNHLRLESLKSVNECLWYQQILSELAETGNSMVPELLDVRVLRQPEPRSARSKEYSYVCLAMRRHEVSFHDWLSYNKVTDDVRARCSRMVDDGLSSPPLVPGAGFLLLSDPVHNATVNRAIRRVLLCVVCLMHTLQERHAFVHHDLHTRNVLLRTDSRDGILPIIMDLENAEGLCRRDGSETLEYVSGAHGYSFMNALTLSYDCYRFFSDVLFLLRQNGLLAFVDIDTVRFLRGCVRSHFDEENAEQDWKTSFKRFQRRVWQPNIVESLCDPIELLRWDAYLAKELDDAMQAPCEFLRLIGGVGDGRAVFVLPKKNTVELRSLRAFFCLDDGIAWGATARNLQLFVQDDFFRVVSHHETLCDILHKLVTCMVYEWDELQCGQSWSWRLSEANSFSGARFARLHMIQTVILAYLRWLYDRCADASSDLVGTDLMGGVGEFSKYHSTISKKRVHVQEHQKVLAILLSHVAPPEYTTHYLRYIECTCRITDFFDTRTIANPFLANLIQRGALRCLPVPCTSVAIEDRKLIDSSEMLHDLAKISMDPRLYYAHSADTFLTLFHKTRQTSKRKNRTGKRGRSSV
ncbi:hypothetical protein CYMTET_47745 [Cymbomonas tetramitiformis]|uniref:Protein kinase domain-containing protein n=1 Tax=Cymbomonas tetramitiformis TaxID=36881 RepID=A0AAE0EVU8_9CHLO|nr:hypothetical protein CYMTET_47745 [Cymbomonas tetramitiformis]|eukprot:gene379-711_t